jgi:hypothetical protein
MYSRMFSTDWKYFWESSRLLRARPCPFECARFATRSSRSKTLIYKLRSPKQKTSSPRKEAWMLSTVRAVHQNCSSGKKQLRVQSHSPLGRGLSSRHRTIREKARFHKSSRPENVADSGWTFPLLSGVGRFDRLRFRRLGAAIGK